MSSTSRALAALLGAAVLLSSSQFAAYGDVAPYDDPPPLNDRITAKFATTPGLQEKLLKPAPEMDQLKWLLGTWSVTASGGEAPPEVGVTTTTLTMDGTWIEGRDVYKGEARDLSYITYNQVTKLWLALNIDRYGNAVMTQSKGPSGKEWIFEGYANIVGEDVNLRQSIRQISDREYTVTNSERMRSGQWRYIDEYRFTKTSD